MSLYRIPEVPPKEPETPKEKLISRIYKNEAARFIFFLTCVLLGGFKICSVIGKHNDRRIKDEQSRKSCIVHFDKAAVAISLQELDAELKEGTACLPSIEQICIEDGEEEFATKLNRINSIIVELHKYPNPSLSDEEALIQKTKRVLFKDGNIFICPR